jgi:2-polyprenyl-6-methoxyphenol 4-hydroxylase
MSDPLSAKEQVDIAIVGGGMVGASLALLLSSLQLGWRIKIVETFPMTAATAEELQPSFDARSTALSHSSREIFEMLGLWETLSSRLADIQEVHVSDRGHMGSTRLHATEQKLPALGYVVENQWLGAVLFDALQRAEGVDIIAPGKVVGVKPIKAGIQLDVVDNVAGINKSIDAKLLVIADGAQSSTREMLGIDATTKDYGQVALVANISLAKDHNGVAYERFTDSGPMAMLPLQSLDDNPRSALIWTLPPAQAEAMLAASDEEFLAQLQQRFGYRIGQFTRVGSRHCYPIRLITSNEQVRRHVVVMGNAAHSLHPVAGQGFNLALRDAAVLANELIRADSEGGPLGDLSVLQGYLKQQQADQKQTILLSDLLPSIFGMDLLPVALVRNLGLLALDLVPLFRNQFARLGMGLETKSTTEIKTNNRESSGVQITGNQFNG